MKSDNRLHMRQQTSANSKKPYKGKEFSKKLSKSTNKLPPSHPRVVNELKRERVRTLQQSSSPRPNQRNSQRQNQRTRPPSQGVPKYRGQTRLATSLPDSQRRNSPSTQTVRRGSQTGQHPNPNNRRPSQSNGSNQSNRPNGSNGSNNPNRPNVSNGSNGSNRPNGSNQTNPTNRPNQPNGSNRTGNTNQSNNPNQSNPNARQSNPNANQPKEHAHGRTTPPSGRAPLKANKKAIKDTKDRDAGRSSLFKNERSTTYRKDFIKANPPFLGKWYLCSLCFKPIRVENMQVDHIFPVSKGGSNKTFNLGPLCAPCNLDKSNKVDSRIISIFIAKMGGNAIGVPLSIVFRGVTFIGKTTFKLGGGLLVGAAKLLFAGVTMLFTSFLSTSLKFKIIFGIIAWIAYKFYF